MRTAQEYFDEYAESHQNKTNKLIHWFCVPTIFFCVTAILFQVKLNYLFSEETINMVHLHFNLAHLVLFFATLFYIQLSIKLAIGTAGFAVLCLEICDLLETHNYPLGPIAITLFVLAWIGQFFGHYIEGKKPSFLKDIQFLLIGPAWLLGFIYRYLGIRL